jgi:hypothetical protein
MNNEELPNKEECALCLEALSEDSEYLDQDVIRTPCNHLFHSECLKEQFNYHQSSTRYHCPVCRRNLLTTIPLDFLCEGLNKDALNLAKKISEEKVIDHWEPDPFKEPANDQANTLFSEISKSTTQRRSCLNFCFISRK